MKKVWLLIFSVCFAISFAFSGTIEDMRAKKWVDSVFLKMTVDERLGQLINLKISPEYDNVETLAKFIRENHIGSVTLIGGDPEAYIALINKISQNARVPLLISNGNTSHVGLTLQSSYYLPDPLTISATRDNDLMEALAKESARQYQSIGINADSYGFLQLQCTGTELKFGNDHTSIEGQPFLNTLVKTYHASNIMANVDLAFDIPQEMPSLIKKMPGSYFADWDLCYQKIKNVWDEFNDPHSTITVTSLPAITPDEAILFRKKAFDPLFWKTLHFKGLIIGDLEAIVQKQHRRIDKSAVWSTLKTGCDVLTVGGNPDEVMDALINGVSEGFFKHGELQSKIERVLRAKYEAGIKSFKQIEEDHIQLKINNPNLRTAIYKTYQKAATILANGKQLIPFDRLDTTNFASLTIGFNSIKTFQTTLEKYAPFVHFALPEGVLDPSDLTELEKELRFFDNVIVGLHTSESLDERVIDFINKLNTHTNIILTYFGDISNTRDFQGIATQIAVYEDNHYTQQIAPQLIFGALKDGTPTQFRMAYSLPEMQNMDSRTLEGIDQIVEEAIKMHATPGCQVLVARNGSVVYEKGFGYYTYDSIMPVDTRTIYDLASVTKVLSTTQAMMYLYDHGLLKLDDTLGTYLPELVGTNKGSLTIRDVLLHQSGLKPFIPFWKNTIEDEQTIVTYYNDKPDEHYENEVSYGMFANNVLKDSIWKWTIDTDLRKKGRRQTSYDYKYSDLGFYLLQVLVERIVDKPLDVFMDSVFYSSLGGSTLGYNPLCKFPIKRIAPTERDNEFRHVLVWGNVHDEIAAMYGGVAGHAGLFSNANDAAKIMQMQLQGGQYGGVRYISDHVVKEFNSPGGKDNRRGLGWDKPERDNGYNPTSRYASYKTFGHRGFTGTAVWADPTFNLIFVFLSNRIYPDAGNSKLIDLNVRKKIHDVIYESIWSFEKQIN